MKLNGGSRYCPEVGLCLLSYALMSDDGTLLPAFFFSLGNGDDIGFVRDLVRGMDSGVLGSVKTIGGGRCVHLRVLLALESSLRKRSR